MCKVLIQAIISEKQLQNADIGTNLGPAYNEIGIYLVRLQVFIVHCMLCKREFFLRYILTEDTATTFLFAIYGEVHYSYRFIKKLLQFV